MRVEITENFVTLYASQGDVYDWLSVGWPCSTLQGNRFTAAFDSTGLVDFTLNGRYSDESDEIDGTELSACCADLLRDRLPKDHPAYFVAVGQFLVEGAT